MYNEHTTKHNEKMFQGHSECPLIVPLIALLSPTQETPCPCYLPHNHSKNHHNQADDKDRSQDA